MHLGYFESQHDAAKAYDVQALLLRGPKAPLNFPKGAQAEVNKLYSVLH